MVIGFWFTALLSNSGHFITPLLLAVTVTLGARWGAGLSLDHVLFRPHGDSGRSPEFGYPIWLMGLCISLAYASAGLSKLYLTDGAWIWEGGTRRGFITDMRDAATLWGAIIVNNLPIAILASIFAAFGQTFYVYSCFTRSLLIKSAIGLLIAIPFLIGLLLFMGLFWWPWFVLVLLWFLPWAKIDDFIGGSLAKATEREPGTRQRNLAVCTAAVLIFGHAYVVVRGIEFEPLFSNYPMYAVAYPMGSELEKRRWNEYKESNPDYVYDVTVETPDGRVAEIGHRYRASTILARFLDIASPYWRAKPNSIWTSAERGEAPGSHCDLQRKALADFIPGEGTADLVYRRSDFDLVDGRLLMVKQGEATASHRRERSLQLPVGRRCGLIRTACANGSHPMAEMSSSSMTVNAYSANPMSDCYAYGTPVARSASSTRAAMDWRGGCKIGLASALTRACCY